jgi:hypothetical protein
MSRNPLNLALRFVLELCMWYALGWWGWMQGEGVARWLFALALALAAMLLWGVFRVPNDGGEPKVEVTGRVRLLIETVLFAAAVAALAGEGRRTLAVVFAVVTAAHYAVSYDRVNRLARNQPL